MKFASADPGNLAPGQSVLLVKSTSLGLLSPVETLIRSCAAWCAAAVELRGAGGSAHHGGRKDHLQRFFEATGFSVIKSQAS